VKIGAALILTSPYIPMLFQGEEWAASSPFLYFVGFEDEPELARAVAEGRCREFASFGWRPEEIPDPTDKASFLDSKLDWNELDSDEHAEMLEWHKRLIALRKQLLALTTGRLELTTATFDTDRNLLEVQRGPICILCNFSKEIVSLAKPFDRCLLVLASKAECRVEKDHVELAPESVAVLAPQWLVDNYINAKSINRTATRKMPAPSTEVHAR
jgi:maltooligosyltrehalose trehalohydrolase